MLFCVLQLCHGSFQAAAFLEYPKPDTQTCAKLARVTAAAHKRKNTMVIKERYSTIHTNTLTHIPLLYLNMNNYITHAFSPGA